MRFYLHIRHGETLISDLEGAEFSTFESARAEAVRGARELLKETLLRGEVLDGRSIEICDENGKVWGEVTLKDQYRLP